MSTSTGLISPVRCKTNNGRVFMVYQEDATGCSAETMTFLKTRLIKRQFELHEYSGYAFNDPAKYSRAHGLDYDVIENLHKCDCLVMCISKQLHANPRMRKLGAYLKNLAQSDDSFKAEIIYLMMDGNYTTLSFPEFVSGWLKHLIKDSIWYPCWSNSQLHSALETVRSVMTLRRRQIVIDENVDLRKLPVMSTRPTPALNNLDDVVGLKRTYGSFGPRSARGSGFSTPRAGDSRPNSASIHSDGGGSLEERRVEGSKGKLEPIHNKSTAALEALQRPSFEPGEKSSPDKSFPLPSQLKPEVSTSETKAPEDDRVDTPGGDYDDEDFEIDVKTPQANTAPGTPKVGEAVMDEEEYADDVIENEEDEVVPAVPAANNEIEMNMNMNNGDETPDNNKGKPYNMEEEVDYEDYYDEEFMEENMEEIEEE